MTVISKYVVTQTSGGEFLPGEPLFVVRARDIASVHAVTGYIDRIPEGTHRDECNQILKAFWDWRALNFDKLEIPWDEE